MTPMHTLPRLNGSTGLDENFALWCAACTPEGFDLLYKIVILNNLAYQN
jgi:hypothetical protein